MKKITFLLGLTLFAVNLKAQTVTIPDANFKNCLVSNTNINTNSNTEIEVSEALAVTRLSIVNKSIADLTGIEAFTNLTYLNCDSNQFTTVDLHANVLLDTLSCAHGPLAGFLDLSALTKLVRCYVPYNFSLTSFKCSNTPSIKWMDIGGTAITALDITKQTNLHYLDIVFTNLSSIDLSQNTKLDTLFASMNKNLVFLDVSKNPLLNVLLLNPNIGGSAKTICVSSTQMAAIPSGWKKKPGRCIQY